MKSIGINTFLVDQTPIKIYLEGNVTVEDKTGGIAKVVFLGVDQSNNNLSHYSIFIDGKKVLFPTTENVVFAGSRKFTLKFKDNLIKITESDINNTKTTLYANKTSCHHFSCYYDGFTNTINQFVTAFKYIPKKISEQEALQKIEKLPSDPILQRIATVYNKYGVAVLGLNPQTQCYSLFWANPYEAQVNPIDFKYDHDGDFSIFKSFTSHICLQYLDRSHGMLKGVLNYRDPEIYYLNLEEASIITTHSQQISSYTKPEK